MLGSFNFWLATYFVPLAELALINAHLVVQSLQLLCIEVLLGLGASIRHFPLSITSLLKTALYPLGVFVDGRNVIFQLRSFGGVGRRLNVLQLHPLGMVFHHAFSS